MTCSHCGGEIYGVANHYGTFVTHRDADSCLEVVRGRYKRQLQEAASQAEQAKLMLLQLRGPALSMGVYGYGW